MDRNLHVAVAATEAVPYAKAGGLADVISALATELQRMGIRVTLVLPGYGSIDRQGFAFEEVEGLDGLAVEVDNRRTPVRMQRSQLPGTEVEVLLLENADYFCRPGIYFDPEDGKEYDDAPERYSFFCRATVAALAALGNRIDVLHMNDYHTALMGVYARQTGFVADFFKQTATVLSIHNLGYQGVFDAGHFPALGLGKQYMEPFGALEFWGKMNFMKAGLELADVITTVSPTYAGEILESDEQALGLEGLLRRRRNDLFGILNGIDEASWDPATDRSIPARYSATDLQGKAVCKRMLQQHVQLQVDAATPLFGMITRLTPQKGLDLLFEAESALTNMPLQLVILGTGQPDYERRLFDWSKRHPERFAIKLGFDEDLAHWIEAGSDFFLMPSRYEPCGLNQMYSMRYGTLPVTRRTGGLADTVIDWNQNKREGTGFVFDSYEVSGLLDALQRALDIFPHAEEMQTIMRRAMMKDFSWSQSASRYLDIYKQAGMRRKAVNSGAPGSGGD